MAHKDMQTYSVEIPVNDPEKVKDFNEFMNRVQDEIIKYIQSVGKELGVSEGVAGDIMYLRGRSRWSQEAEDELIRRDKAGAPRVNIFEWPEA